MRLSMSSLAGTARTLVAVGTVRLVSMLATTRAAAPRSGCAGGPPDRRLRSRLSPLGAAARAARRRAGARAARRAAGAALRRRAGLAGAGPVALVAGVPAAGVLVAGVPVAGVLLVGVLPAACRPAYCWPACCWPACWSRACRWPAWSRWAGWRRCGLVGASPLGVSAGAAVALASVSAAGAGAAAPLPPSGSTVRWSPVGRDEPLLSRE